jgi:tyrosine-protein kinase Etk/Wzc
MLALMVSNKWLMIVIVAGMTVLFPLLLSFRAPTCEGVSVVLINAKAGQVVNPLQQGNDAATNKITNEMAFLKARGLARKVALDIMADPWLDSAQTSALPILLLADAADSASVVSDIEIVTDRLQKAVTFVAEKESDVIKIITTSQDPREAARLSNSYAEMYRQEAMRQSRSQSSSVREFLEGRLAEQRDQLRSAETEMKRFMETNGVTGMDEETNRILHELTTLEGTRNGLQVEIEGLNKRLYSLEATLPDQEASVAKSLSQASNSYITLLSQHLSELEVQRDVLIAQNDPAVLSQGANQAKLKDIHDRIKSLQENLQKRTTELIWGSAKTGSVGQQSDPLYYIRSLRQQILEAKIQLATLSSRKAALDGIIVGYEGQFGKMPQKRLEYTRIQRERLSTERLYTLVEAKFNEATITEKSEFGYVTIIDHATPAGSKPRSSSVLYALVGFVVGVGLAVGLVFFREANDVRVRLPEQLRERGYHALAEVSSMEKDLKTLEFNGFIPPEAADFSPVVKVIFHPMSFTAESYRRLRTGLMRLKMEKPLTTVLMSSSNPGEGKSTTLANLATSLAETGQKTLLIDTDFRRPTLHTLFGLQRSPGFAELVEKGEDAVTAIHRDVVPGLDVITCGGAVKYPSRFFGDQRTIDAVASLRERYAWVLMDAPPMLVVNDAGVLAAMADGTILIVEAGTTRLEALDRSIAAVQDAGGNVIGVVLNRFDPKAAYGSYYGSSRYGHYSGDHAYYHSTTEEDDAK